jgi:parallel beta-helix repeat protein
MIDTDGSQPGPFKVSVEHNSIHDFTKDGIHAVGPGVTLDIQGNSISGVGPSVGTLQFGVYLITGAGGHVTANHITEGTCGSLSLSDCANLRSEGVVLRAAADNTVVDGNFISNAQAGIFINGGNNLRISNNVISNVDVFEPIHIQAGVTGFLTNSLIQGNTIYNTTPIANEVCGIAEVSGSGTFGQNSFVNNTINDAYCGIVYVTADANHVEGNRYFNTLYATINGDLFPTVGPPPVEP